MLRSRADATENKTRPRSVRSSLRLRPAGGNMFNGHSGLICCDHKPTNIPAVYLRSLSYLYIWRARLHADVEKYERCCGRTNAKFSYVFLINSHYLSKLEHPSNAPPTVPAFERYMQRAPSFQCRTSTNKVTLPAVWWGNSNGHEAVVMVDQKLRETHNNRVRSHTV